MMDLILDTLIDTAKMLPFLFLAYLLIEFIEHRAMNKVKKAFSSDKLGIVSGAALGLFPQCGFSVAAANLFAESLITAGTVVAVFVSTSDEALPILLSELSGNPKLARVFLPLFGIKFCFAVLAGFAVNGIFRLLKLDRVEKLAHHHDRHHDHTHEHDSECDEHIHESGEHHHCAHCDSSKGILENAIKRTLEIALFILITVFVLNLIIEGIGEESLKKVLMTDSFVQPLIAGLIGLIPNCAASVVLTELYVSGTLSFGALVSGLCAGAGLGVLVLFRVNRNLKQNLTILVSLYLLSAVFGMLLQFLSIG